MHQSKNNKSTLATPPARLSPENFDLALDVDFSFLSDDAQKQLLEIQAKLNRNASEIMTMLGAVTEGQLQNSVDYPAFKNAVDDIEMQLKRMCAFPFAEFEYKMLKSNLEQIQTYFGDDLSNRMAFQIFSKTEDINISVKKYLFSYVEGSLQTLTFDNFSPHHLASVISALKALVLHFEKHVLPHYDSDFDYDRTAPLELKLEKFSLRPLCFLISSHLKNPLVKRAKKIKTSACNVYWHLSAFGSALRR